MDVRVKQQLEAGRTDTRKKQVPTRDIHSDSSTQRRKPSAVTELGMQAFISFLKLFFTCRTSHTSMGTTSHCWNASCFPP